jgi:hypothetical protein
MVYGIGCGAYTIFFARIQDILSMAVSHPAVRLSSSWWRTQYDFVPSISANPVVDAARDISRLSAPQFSSPETFFLCAVPSYLQIIDSRTRCRERQVYKFPTPLVTIPPGAGFNTHTTHPHPHPQNMHHTGTTGTTLSFLRTPQPKYAHTPTHPSALQQDPKQP